MTDAGRDEPRSPKRWFIGEPLPSGQLEGQLLPKHLALPIFASDPLSSVAYAPQELLMILLLGGLAFLSFAPWVAAAVVVLLVVVVLSYRQLIKAYPSGGGDYEVASKNIGEKAGLVVASALLVDYVLTVAVSVASGVDNIISAIPQLDGIRIEIAVGFVILLAAVNLRGVRESSKAFAVPTYLFIASIAVMIVTALIRTAAGDAPVAESANLVVSSGEDISKAAFILLLLRAFASGCAALTGVEAISNGVPAFRRPKIQNAQKTLMAMGGTAIVLFSGLVAVALIAGVHYVDCTELTTFVGCADGDTPQRSLIAQMASATFGDGSIVFFLIQAVTAAVLLLAANTAFNGFPLLGSVLATDRYAPKSLATRGDRLIYSNGVIALSVTAVVLLVIFRADVTALIQLYIIGVFVSFTLGQTGMVRHWLRMLREGCDNVGAVRRGLVINAVGAVMTFSVLLIVTVTKFTHGAWIVFVIMPILFLLMLGVNRYYRDVDIEIEADATTKFGAEGDHAIVLVGRMQKPVLKALDYAIAARHESIEAVHVSIDDEATSKLERDWIEHNIQVPLKVLESPYRDISMPLIKYIKHRRAEHGSEVVTVYTPHYIVGHWWENLLHNHKARRIRHKLTLVHGVVIALVPWLLDSSTLIYGRRSRPLPGQDRRGEPLRPIPRSDASGTSEREVACPDGGQGGRRREEVRCIAQRDCRHEDRREVGRWRDRDGHEDGTEGDCREGVGGEGDGGEGVEADSDEDSDEDECTEVRAHDGREGGPVRDEAAPAVDEVGHHARMIPFAVLVGGVVGTGLRLTFDALLPHPADEWPWSTFLVNVIGAFLLAMLVARVWPTAPGWLRAGLGTGVLGSFTTFSALAVSAVELTSRGVGWLAVAYAVGSIVAGLLAAWLGLRMGRGRRIRSVSTRPGPSLEADE